MSETYVCSVCGTPCGQDSRMGSLDVYLVCSCSEPRNRVWVDDGRGGYDVTLNGAKPVRVQDFQGRRS